MRVREGEKGDSEGERKKESVELMVILRKRRSATPLRPRPSPCPFPLSHATHQLSFSLSHQPTNQPKIDKHYVKAVSGYSAALSLDPNSAVLFSNRAAAHLKLENYGSALADAGKAIEIDPKYVKAYYRRADAAAGLGRVRDALRDFRTAAKVAPRDPDLQVKLKAAEKEVARLRFEAAIAVPDADAVPVAERVDLASMPVEPSYDGPRMEGDDDKGYTISKKFVEEMVEAFRQQKKVHKRFAFEIVLTAQKILKELPPLVDVPVPRGKHLTVRREFFIFTFSAVKRERGRGHERRDGIKLTFFSLFLQKPLQPPKPGLRRRPRPVLRPPQHLLLGRWPALRLQPLSVQRRLCRPRLFFCRGDFDPFRLQVSLPYEPALGSREPRDRGHEPHLRLRWRGASQVRWFARGPLPRGFLCSSLGARRRREGPGGPRRAVLEGRGHFGRPEADRQVQGAAGRRGECFVVVGVCVWGGGGGERRRKREGRKNSLENSKTQNQKQQLMCELLWSDPGPDPGRQPSKRGVGVAFGPDVTKNFLANNGLDLLVRSHEVKEEGFAVEHDGYCITVFSAPNYVDQMGNLGAFIRFDGGGCESENDEGEGEEGEGASGVEGAEDDDEEKKDMPKKEKKKPMTPQFTTFAASPHPPVRPMAYASTFMGGMGGGFGF